MTEIRFYHLQKQSLDQALPLILEKASEAGHRSHVKMQNEKEVERMSGLIWSYKKDSFLPHGTFKDGNQEHQPIWLTDQDANLNNAKTLILTQGQTSDHLSEYDLVCEMLNGNSDEQISAARSRWKTYQDAGFETTYWLQKENGGWTKKA